MAEQKELSYKSKKANGVTGNIPLLDILFLTLRKWPWIILSVVLCVGAAYAHLLRTPNVYTRSAEILIKDESKGQSSAGDEFANLGLFQSNANIQNEMINLKSKDLMEEVVKRLGLDVNYFYRHRFHDAVAYGYDLPVKLDVIDFPEEDCFEMSLTVNRDGKVLIKDLVMPDGTTSEQQFTANINDTIDTPLGKVVVSPTNSFQPGVAKTLIIKKSPVSSIRDSFVSRLGVSMVNEKGTVVRLVMTDESIQRADAVLGTLIGLYNENWICDKNQVAVSTSNFINDRLNVIENELGNVDADISSYKSANLIPDVGAAASMYMTQSQQTQSQILDVKNQLSVARYIRTYLASDAHADQLLPVNTGLVSSNLQILISEYNDKLLQRNSLASKSSERNPLVTQLDEQLAAQRQAIAKTIDNEIVTLDTQLQSLRSQESQTMSHIASNPAQAKALLSVERQQKVKESLYLYLLQKREENELSQAFTPYNTRIVNKPGGSRSPSAPNRRNILAVALLVGLFIPFGATYIRETTNTKLRGRKDIEHLLVPFLGEIPQYDKAPKDKDEHKLVVKPGKRDIINEAFRVLRTNVELICNSFAGSKVIAVTSFNPGSGKSFITVNLAKSIALNGKNVLVIDGDMRHGSASSYVNSPDKGLSDYLCGTQSEYGPLIVKDATCDTLSIMPIGPIPPNPTELLESGRFAQLIAEVKQKYDYVMIDCPPIEVVADTHIIDQYVDRTFFVIRAGLLERSMLPELDRLYDEKKFTNMAMILNGTRNHQGRYGYSHSYRYGYGYGYGYGYNYGDRKKNIK